MIGDSEDDDEEVYSPNRKNERAMRFSKTQKKAKSNVFVQKFFTTPSNIPKEENVYEDEGGGDEQVFMIGTSQVFFFLIVLLLF